MRKILPKREAIMKLKEGIYYVGAQNPALRVFDIIMQTEFGTTYNAYIARGSEKTALIETAHHRFFDWYLRNVEAVAPLSEIDYVVLNHTEPDHSGSLEKLLALNPSLTVVGSMAGVKYAEKIANRSFTAKIVKDGDVLDLGGKTLRFINAPFLHWPDSMFTYIPEDKILFSCDFLGAHYCEPQILDKNIVYPDGYARAFEYYYNAIFGPFKAYVLKGLEKIEGLEIDMLAPSHGPVLTDGVESAKAKYKAWSEAGLAKNPTKKVLILYVSAYGYTRKMAKTIAAALKDEKAEIELLDAITVPATEIGAKLNADDVLFIGSPTINRDALAPIWNALSMLDAIGAKGKPAGVFGSYGWSGEAVGALIARLNGLKLTVLGEGVRANFKPDASELEAVAAYAKLAAPYLR
jgi:flavorubredoxin